MAKSKSTSILRSLTGAAICFLLTTCQSKLAESGPALLALNDSNYFEAPGLNILVFSNSYDGMFDDSKMAGVEIVHHGLRTATNGDVRLNPTPGQWDLHPTLVERRVERDSNLIIAQLKYDDPQFTYQIQGRTVEGGFSISVWTDQPVPSALAGTAGLNLEFTPMPYFGRTWVMDERIGEIPQYPDGQMTTLSTGETEPLPIATGKRFSIAPDDPERHITVTTSGEDLMFYDGRNKAQNGWFVLRSLLPAGKSGKLVEWFITANTIPGWVRKPNIGHSQTGYLPIQPKLAVIELDKNDKSRPNASLLRVNDDGSTTEVLTTKPKEWGRWQRYDYVTFDFSSVTKPGVYKLSYGKQTTLAFPIADDVYQRAWHNTLDVFLPVQMDHMFVREAYRVWHGAPHLDDALQAPVNYSHWDGWRQGPVTGNKYKPLEHIPGLNVGGWFDAGDFDIQTPSQQAVINALVQLWEEFDVARDETLIDQANRYVEIHLPDGKPDVLQQIEHGALQLVAQVKAVGYALQGINESHLWQYRHLGDAANKTNNRNYTGQPEAQTYHPRSGERPYNHNSKDFDDRFAFTTRSAHLDYGSVTALAAAARTLRGYNDALAAECLASARKLFDDWQQHPIEDKEPFVAGYMTTLEARAAYELWRATGDATYRAHLDETLPNMLSAFSFNAPVLASMIPHLGNDFRDKLEPYVRDWVHNVLEPASRSTPFGVAVSRHSWAGNSLIISQATAACLLHKHYPALVDTKYVFAGLSYLYGTHADSDISFVSGVGAYNKRVAYGNNRADFSFIAGGVVPGIRLLKPDLPENRNDYPFIWSENEYVIDIAAAYILYVVAVNQMTQ
ncbi:hypothetical protein GGR06_002145 [Bacteroides reticulotermitis]|uniref:Glycoside hydrolase n=1 Tax=Bacteroides reticulotermitis TaxID=1133319 RepID=A0A840CZU3_9BACE|nr:glycoside hydrolase family 9 protein [Bacteroides reticulotermitis]MBB4044351.1 hypothetical protein [Bacteroides reticulotermitis]